MGNWELKDGSVFSPEPAPAATGQPWFALRVRSNFEKIATQALISKDLDPFLPIYRSRRQWSDRIKEIDRPLFPGYVFCRFDPQHRLPVLTCPGVVGMVEFGGEPAPVPEGEIAAVRALLNAHLDTQPWPFLAVGQKVRIRQGPLAGVEGVVEQFKSGYRLIVSVELLQRSVAAEIEGAWIEPVASPVRPSARVGRTRA